MFIYFCLEKFEDRYVKVILEAKLWLPCLFVVHNYENSENINPSEEEVYSTQLDQGQCSLQFY